MRISELAQQWAQDATDLRPRTLVGYLYCLRSFAKFGLVHLHDLSVASLERYFAERRRAGVTPETLNRHLAALCTFLRWCWRKGLFDRQAIEDLRALAPRCPRPKRPRALRREEYQRLRQVARELHPLFELSVRIGWHTGARLGEIRVMQHQDFSLSVAEPFVRIMGGTKTDASNDTVPISQAFALDLIRMEFPEKRGPVFPAFRRRTNDDPCLALTTFMRWMAVARVAAGLGDDVGYQSLRAGFATAALERGVPLAVVARWLRHAGIQTAYRHYMGAAPGGDARIDKVFDVTPPHGTTPPTGTAIRTH